MARNGHGRNKTTDWLTSQKKREMARLYGHQHTDDIDFYHVNYWLSENWPSDFKFNSSGTDAIEAATSEKRKKTKIAIVIALLTLYDVVRQQTIHSMTEHFPRENPSTREREGWRISSETGGGAQERESYAHTVLPSMLLLLILFLLQ